MKGEIFPLAFLMNGEGLSYTLFNDITSYGFLCGREISLKQFFYFHIVVICWYRTVGLTLFTIGVILLDCGLGYSYSLHNLLGTGID